MFVPGMNFSRLLHEGIRKAHLPDLCPSPSNLLYPLSNIHQIVLFHFCLQTCIPNALFEINADFFHLHQGQRFSSVGVEMKP
jgi:hypothetical protein